MRVVDALGGNALLRRGQELSAENQRVNAREACRALAPERALAQARRLIAEGADIIDVGAESTRPYGGAQPVSAEMELRRLQPVLADIVSLGAEHQFVRRRELQSGKVALISGGGSGHEPLHAGFVGRGMLDAACPGQVFTSPTPDQMVAAVEAVETGSGCLFIVKNYEGDVMNFQMAAELAGKEVATVVTDDGAPHGDHARGKP